jgi:hypothetical protein
MKCEHNKEKWCQVWNGFIDQHCNQRNICPDFKQQLTALESEFLKLLRENNNPDDYNCDETGCWFTLDTVCDNNGLDIKKQRGVLSSLIKKGLIIDLNEKAPDNTNYHEYTWTDVQKEK